jgi:asparagine synthase (glutamine-hydrolysing)
MSGFLPNKILNKKKHGFGLPFGLWLRDSPLLRQLIADNLSDLRKRQIISSAFLDTLQALHSREDASYYGVFIWVFAMLEQWFREHEVSP